MYVDRVACSSWDRRTDGRQTDALRLSLDAASVIFDVVKCQKRCQSFITTDVVNKGRFVIKY